MIQAYIGTRLVVGVTRGNIDKLTNGHPILIELLKRHSVREIVVLFGEDKPAILAEMEAAGLEIAEAWKESARNDPS